MRQAARYFPEDDDEGDYVGEEEPANDEEDAPSEEEDGDGEIGEDEPDDETDDGDANEPGPHFIPGSCLPKSTVAKIRIVELVRTYTILLERAIQIMSINRWDTQDCWGKDISTSTQITSGR